MMDLSVSDVFDIIFWTWSAPRDSSGVMHKVIPLIHAAIEVKTRVLPPPVGRTSRSLRGEFNK